MSPIIGARGGLSASAYGLFAPSLATNSYESIATVSVGAGGQSSISFTSIPSTYKHLQVRGIYKTTNAVNLYMRFNGDAATNYSWHYIDALGSGTPSAGGAGNQAEQLLPVSSNITSTFNAVVIDILDYSNTSKNKTSRIIGGVDRNGSGWIDVLSGGWRNTVAVNSIIIGGDTLSEFTQFALYGIKG